MSDVKVALITASGSGMGADSAHWPLVGSRLVSCRHLARVRPWPRNWVGHGPRAPLL